MAEIAGLVLGVVPLVISALENYEAFIEPTVAFIRWRGRLSQITRRLLMEYTNYEQNLRLLLKRAVEDGDLTAMIEDPHHHLWASTEMVLDLKRDLGGAFDSSMETIEEISSILVTIFASLNIQGSDRVCKSFITRART